MRRLMPSVAALDRGGEDSLEIRMVDSIRGLL